MQPIQGINLKSELEIVRLVLLIEQKKSVQKMINDIYQDLHRWQKEQSQAEATAQKCAEKVTEAQAKLEKLAAGDWSVLKEEQHPQARLLAMWRDPTPHMSTGLPDAKTFSPSDWDD